MTHDQARALLLDLAYGELEPDVAREVSQHAAGCPECAGELARIAGVRGAASKLEDRPPGRASREELLVAARRAASGGRPRRWLGRPATLSFAAAAAVVVIVAGVTLKLTREELGGARDEQRGATETATPRAAEPPRVQERRDAPPQPAAPVPAVRRPSAPAAPAPAPTPAPAPAGAARKSAQPSAASDQAASPAAAAAGASRRAAGGSLPAGFVEERRQLRCGDVLVERVALVAPGGRVVKLTERRGEILVEGWYDEDGRLRDAGGRQQAATGAPAPVPALPLVAPTLESLGTTCTW